MTDERLRRAAAAPVARLATVDAEGRPHLVPCCFALEGDVAYSVVDHARIVEDGPEHASAIALLCAKYPQYNATPPSGSVVAIDVTASRTWVATA